MSDLATIITGIIASIGLIGWLVLGLLFFVVLPILWILLPFAVFKIRSRMDQLITAVTDLGNWQKAMLGEIKAIGKQLEKLNQGQKQPPQPTIPLKSLKDQATDIRENKV